MRCPGPGLSAAGTFRSLKSFLPAALVSDQAKASLTATLDAIPASLSRRFYFECRLAAARPDVDVILAVAPREGWALAAAGETGCWASLAAATWPRLVELAREWTDPHPGREVNASVIWLEFDVPAERGGGATPPPGVFLTRGGVGAGTASRLDEQIAVFSRLRGAPFAPDVVDGCHRVLASLPPGARVVHVGLMHARDPNVLRLCVSHLNGSVLLRYLNTIGWHGSIAAVEQGMSALRCPSVPDPLASVTLVHLDIHDGVCPRLGLELPFLAHAQLAGVTAETDLLDRLCELGWSVPSKCAAAAAWPGRARIWLEHLRSMTPLVCRLSNLKLVWDGRCEPEAKVYLSAFHGSGLA